MRVSVVMLLAASLAQAETQTLSIPSAIPNEPWTIASASGSPHTSTVVISEFMASNARTLADADGDHPDWIELHNSGDAAVNLDGWFLTDDAGLLRKWRLPGVQLEAGGFLVVFASGKDRSVAGQELHTSFQLDDQGEFLALVEPDGETIATQFAPRYPPQKVDVAYGRAAPFEVATLIAPGASTRALIPTNDALGDIWTAPGFVPDGWISGTNGVGYGLLDPPSPPPASRLLWLAADQGVTTNSSGAVTAWADADGSRGHWIEAVRGSPHAATAPFPRGPRSVIRFAGNKDGFLLLKDDQLRVNPISVYVVASIDAGERSAIFIANYRDVSGYAVGISDAVSQRVKWFTAPPGDGFDDGLVSFPAADLAAERNYLLTATFDGASNTKVLRVLNEIGTNSYTASGTFHSQASYAVDTQLAVGNLDFGRQFLDGDIAEILVYGSLSPAQREAVEAYLMDKYFAPQARVPSPLVGTDVGTWMSGVNPSAYTRTPFQLPAPVAFSRATLRMQYDDGFVAYLDGQEIARRNAPGTPGVLLPFNAAASSDRPLAAARAAESIDVTPWVAGLGVGDHVLAIQGLNDSANSPDLLIRPEIIAETALEPALETGYLQTPTPGARNNTDAYLGRVADTKFSVDRGFYDTPISVAITSATPGVEIRYTLDGSPPAAHHGLIHSSPLSISNTTTLRAAAFKSGWLPSDVDTHTYIFVSDVVRQSPDGRAPLGWPASPLPTGQALQYGMDPRVVTNAAYSSAILQGLKSLPAFSLVLEQSDLFGARGIYANPSGDGREWERPGSVELIYPDGQAGFQVDAGVRIRGGQSRMVSNPKHAFRLFFRAEYGAGALDYPLFKDSPVERFQQFDLRMDQNDSWSFVGDCCGDPAKAIYLRDVFSRDTQLAMGQPSTRSDYYHLYLNGQYWGLANTQERPEADFAASYFGGVPADYDVIKVDWGPFTVYATDGDMAAWTELYTLLKADLGTEAAYQRLLGNHPDGTRNPAFPIYLEADNLIDFMLITIFTANLDSAISTFSGRPNNWYAIRPRDGRAGFRFFVHDAELTMLSVNADRTVPPSSAGDASVLDSSPEWMWHRLLANPTFRVQVGDRIHRHFFNDGVLTSSPAKARLMARKAEIDLAIIAESARWGDARRATPYTRDAEWLALVNQLAVSPNCYLDQRPAVVLVQLTADGLYPALAAPLFSQFGGVVPAGFGLNLVAPAGGIYFTLDGSDPRTLAGGVSPAANPYTDPIALDESTVVRARSFDGTTWSALAEATFEVARAFDTLLVTEIMYHPLPGLETNGTAVDGDEYEFLELKNAGTNTLNLGGMTFTAGLSFAFTNGTRLEPGRFFVLARNPVRFAERYPGVAVNGVYSGKLDNAGETLRLAHVLGTPAWSITYGERAPWPVTPDGHGFSLVPTGPDATFDADDARHWRASSSVGGSPGTDDPVSTLPPIVINEVLTASLPPDLDAIELFNPTAADLDLGGWVLTDDPGQPGKFRIPAGSTIAAGGYLVFDETDFNPTPGTTTSFALGADGDEVYLFSGDLTGNLTGYGHGLSVGAAAPGVTFGRHLSSTGEESFPAQRAPSLGTTNAGPLVGPVVINEIHYHPAPGADEFIELKNIAATNVALFDPAHPANAWRLDGVGYAFPTELTLLPGQVVLLVATDPASFRTRYAVPADVAVLGPWPGVLQDSGERLDLQQPGPPDTNAFVPRITVDQTRYNDKLPWPAAADGSGPSLQRRSDLVYGGDPASWEAAAATPGRLFPGGAPPAILSHPTNLTVRRAGEAVLAVGATGAEPLFYQWQFNGAPIAGATAATLALADVQVSQAGSYTAVVFNESGSAVSQPATLTVLVPASIVVQPKDVLVRIRPDPQAAPATNATFLVVASAPTPLRYQWRFNGHDLPGATRTSLTISNVQVSDAGAYDVAITGAEGTLLSATAHLYPLVTPVVLQHPLSQTVVAGGAVTLSVAFTGSPAPFSNEWRRGSTLVETHVLNDPLDFFSFTAPNLATTLQYRAWIRNLATPSGGTLTTIATITVQADADADGLPDAWEAAYDVDDPNADRDGDGVRNRDEYQAGTNPTNALSFLRVDLSAVSPQATLRFGAASNLTYSLQFQNMVGGGWATLVDLPARKTNRLETITHTNTTGQGFYRVVTPRQP